MSKESLNRSDVAFSRMPGRCPIWWVRRSIVYLLRKGSHSIKDSLDTCSKTPSSLMTKQLINRLGDRWFDSGGRRL